MSEQNDLQRILLPLAYDGVYDLITRLCTENPVTFFINECHHKGRVFVKSGCLTIAGLLDAFHILRLRQIVPIPIPVLSVVKTTFWLKTLYIFIKYTKIYFWCILFNFYVIYFRILTKNRKYGYDTAFTFQPGSDKINWLTSQNSMT